MTSLFLLAATIFVTNERAGSITVIDSQTDAMVRTFAVGTRTRGMAVNCSTAKLIASSPTSKSVRSTIPSVSRCRPTENAFSRRPAAAMPSR